MKRRAIVSTVGLLAILGGAGYVLVGRNEAPVVYRLGKVEGGSIVSMVSASGTLKPSSSAVVSSAAAGQIKEVLADINQEVKAGQALGRLDSEAAQARLDTALADLEVARQGVEVARGQVERARREADNARALQASAEADAQHAALIATDARRDLKRKHTLGTTGDVAPVDTERSESAYGAASAGVASAQARAVAASAAGAAADAATAVAQAQLKNAEATVAAREAAVRQAQVELAHTTLRAPIDGIVMDRTITVGQSVGGSAAAAPLFMIAADLRHLEVHASVNEADIGRVASGQAATFTFDAFPGQTFSGVVAEISTLPQPLQSVVAYDVVIAAENADRKLFPGMTAEVRIVIGRRDDALKVPNAALRFRPVNYGAESARPAGSDAQAATGGPEVWRLDRNGRPYANPVRTGLTDGVSTEVIGGDLKKGDDVIVGMSQSPGETARVGPLKF